MRETQDEKWVIEIRRGKPINILWKGVHWISFVKLKINNASRE